MDQTLLDHCALWLTNVIQRQNTGTLKEEAGYYHEMIRINEWTIYFTCETGFNAIMRIEWYKMDIPFTLYRYSYEEDPMDVEHIPRMLKEVRAQTENHTYCSSCREYKTYKHEFCDDCYPYVSEGDFYCKGCESSCKGIWVLFTCTHVAHMHCLKTDPSRHYVCPECDLRMTSFCRL